MTTILENLSQFKENVCKLNPQKSGDVQNFKTLVLENLEILTPVTEALLKIPVVTSPVPATNLTTLKALYNARPLTGVKEDLEFAKNALCNK